MEHNSSIDELNAIYILENLKNSCENDFNRKLYKRDVQQSLDIAIRLFRKKQKNKKGPFFYRNSHDYGRILITKDDLIEYANIIKNSEEYENTIELSIVIDRLPIRDPITDCFEL